MNLFSMLGNHLQGFLCTLSSNYALTIKTEIPAIHDFRHIEPPIGILRYELVNNNTMQLWAKMPPNSFELSSPANQLSIDFRA
jgi:hypothetical protein